MSRLLGPLGDLGKGDACIEAQQDQVPLGGGIPGVLESSAGFPDLARLPMGTGQDQ
jgi:hypothetical protein